LSVTPHRSGPNMMTYGESGVTDRGSSSPDSSPAGVVADADSSLKYAPPHVCPSLCRVSNWNTSVVPSVTTSGCGSAAVTAYR
jgi:hypothetical protein